MVKREALVEIVAFSYFEAYSAALTSWLRAMRPEATLTANDAGRLPLHDACRHDAPSEVVQLLIERCPEALTTADALGALGGCYYLLCYA